MQPNLNQLTAMVRTSLEAAMCNAHQEAMLPKAKDYKSTLSASINLQLKLLCSKIPSLVFHAGGTSTLRGNHKYEVNITIREAGNLEIPTAAEKQEGRKYYKINFSLTLLQETCNRFLNQAKSIFNLTEADFHLLSQHLRKISSAFLAVSLPLQKAFQRANLYSPPRPGSTVLVIFEKKIFNQRIIYKPLFEMNAVTAGKVATGLKFAGKGAGILAVGAAVLDINKQGFTTSNSIDLAMTGLALSGFGTAVATCYFIINGCLIIFTEKDLGQRIDEIIK